MADQDYIKGVVQQLSDKFEIAKADSISAMLGLVEGKTNAEAIVILNELDVGAVMVAKTSGILTAYASGNVGVLASKELFADISEVTLRALLTQSEQYLSGQIAAMSGTIKQEVINGIINKKTVNEIMDVVGTKGYGATGMKRILNDGLNNYSRSVSRMMMDEAPKEAKYVYIGPADEKTRPFCLSAIQAGSITMDQINSMGGEWSASLTEGGGINCRHSWELASSDVRSQFHRGKEAEDIINA
tara:strand:- start:470 stop:1201 length:732 start_codon:yes stop_codon:yes gene_type:complete